MMQQSVRQLRDRENKNEIEEEFDEGDARLAVFVALPKQMRILAHSRRVYLRSQNESSQAIPAGTAKTTRKIGNSCATL
jgi:hypothetical protein